MARTAWKIDEEGAYPPLPHEILLYPRPTMALSKSAIDLLGSLTISSAESVQLEKEGSKCQSRVAQVGRAQN